MRFDGQVWFDFSSPPVWVFYQWVLRLAGTGTEVALDWMPRPIDEERAAMATLLTIEDPRQRGRFLHAMLGLVHMEKRSASEMATVAEALRAAGLDTVLVHDEHPLLEDLAERCADLGIESVPSLVRHGPALSIQLNPAVLHERPQKVARTIDEVMEIDGIWELKKP